MRKFKVLIISMIVLFGTNSGNAQSDHLEPVGEILDIYSFEFEYYSKVRKVLFKGITDIPEIRFLVMPSFTPENVLAIEYDRENEKYFLVYHVCDKMIWYNEQWEKVKVIKYRKEINMNSVELIKSLFKNAISQTKYSENENMSPDGTNYYFTIHDSGQKTGVVWSPSEGTKMSRLVNVGYGLIKLAKNKDSLIDFDNKFREEIDKLLKELK